MENLKYLTGNTLGPIPDKIRYKTTHILSENQTATVSSQSDPKRTVNPIVTKINMCNKSCVQIETQRIMSLTRDFH
jgi:hypothetical protein